MTFSLQIEDLKAQSEEAATKAKEGGKKLQDQIFQPGPALPEGVSREVHNLNSMVKKKKKPAATPAPASAATPAPVLSESQEALTNGANGKRKAEDDNSEPVSNGTTEPVEKKVRIEEPSA